MNFRQVSQPRRSVPTSTLNEYIASFEENLYAVWPVLDAPDLTRRLELLNSDIETYVLSLALSAAVASQLQLPVFGPDPKIDAAYMASQVVKIRSRYDYREGCSLDTIRTSFFLHVYYAVLLKYHSSMLYLQEAITFARLLVVRFKEQLDVRTEQLDTLMTLLVSHSGTHSIANLSYLEFRVLIMPSICTFSNGIPRCLTN